MRAIEHALDDIFQPRREPMRMGNVLAGVGNSEMDDSVPRGKKWDPYASTDTFMGEDREKDEDDDDDKAKKDARRKLADDDEDGVNHDDYHDGDNGGHSDDYWNSVADNETPPPGEKKESTRYASLTDSNWDLFL